MRHGLKGLFCVFISLKNLLSPFIPPAAFIVPFKTDSSNPSNSSNSSNSSSNQSKNGSNGMKYDERNHYVKLSKEEEELYDPEEN